MPKLDAASQVVGRLGVVAAWISAVCCLPYLFLKVVWTFDVPVGITDRSVLDDNGWVAANALMAVIQLVGLLLVLALTRSWSRRVPAWLLLFPVWAGTGLLFEIIVGAVLLGLFSPPSHDSGEDLGGFEPWVYELVYASFTGQGIALAIAFACHVRSRWGRLLGQRTGDVVARRPARVRSWPEGHLAGLADAVAAMTAVVALIFCYWAVGGSFGLSGAHAEDPWSLHAARVAGAVTAGVGLLALAGHWGRQRQFWLPATLTWLGSGALAAFDGFLLMFTALPVLFGAIVAEWGWSMTDTLLVIKVLIGVLAAGVGAVAVAAAALEDQVPPAPVGAPRRRAQAKRAEPESNRLTANASDLDVSEPASTLHRHGRADVDGPTIPSRACCMKPCGRPGWALVVRPFSWSTAPRETGHRLVRPWAVVMGRKAHRTVVPSELIRHYRAALTSAHADEGHAGFDCPAEWLASAYAPTSAGRRTSCSLSSSVG